ncbi:MAG TPA: IPT/TIG domain-containing protein, partial [Niastella sp.]|nr:IPT/TIG domain-containing protein [Niastella sp.]
MKRTYCIALVVLSIIYASCQKETTGILPDTSITDSTTTGVDSSINSNNDSLTILSFAPDSGRVGTFVTISGTGFDSIAAGNSVAFNGMPAVVFSATDLTLVVQVQAGTTTGKLAVTAHGNTAYSTSDFIIRPDTVASNTNVWARKADVSPGSHMFINGFSINGNGYLFTGADLWAYDPVSNTWSKKKSLPADYWHRYGFCFVVGTKAYVGLGAGYPGEDYNNEYRNKKYLDVWEYDALQDNWVQKASFPGASRVMPFSFSENGMGYMGGGDTTHGGSGNAHDFWKYDPTTDSWTRMADFPGTVSIGFSG